MSMSLPNTGTVDPNFNMIDMEKNLVIMQYESLMQ